MTRWRELTPRLAGLMSRRPLQVALVALLIGLLGATGLFRFSVDAGQSLLVGSSSTAGQTYAKFSQTFGSDPIVLVFSTRQGAAVGNTTAPYIERNLQRLGALELDLAHDPRVASVLGPGTAAGALRQAAVSEVNKVLTEYPYFIAETDYLAQLRAGNTDQTALRTRLQNDITQATQLLEIDVGKAAQDAHNARNQYQAKPGDTILDSREKAVDAVVAQDTAFIPPLWAEYLAGPGQPTNPTASTQFFARVAAAYGDCDDQLATLLGIQASCQVFFERTLLDLPKCPPVNSHQFCQPKPQWSAVLPAVQPGAEAFEVITIRLKPEYVGGQSIPAPGCAAPCSAASLVDKINNELSHGIADDNYTSHLSATSRTTLKSLGPLAPTECGGATAQQDAACNSAFQDKPLTSVIAGAPLLGLGVVRSMSQLLAILFPVALFVMLLLLVGVFRVRGRVWPLLAAVAATVLTVGIGLLTGTPITPAVLAGVPVLIGLGVDYAVQLVARYSEERGRGVTIEESLRAAIGNTGHATLIAAAATLVGLAALALFGGIDWGPLVAVPLVAEFALVLCGGVVLAWLGALFIALPLAVWSDKRTPIPVDAPEANAADVQRGAGRTIAIADNWRGVVFPAAVLAVAGWVLLHVVPVQTDVQALLAPTLPELGNIQTVQSETGYTNEVDVYMQGQVVTGPIDAQTGTPVSVEWQCGAASLIRTDHADSVVQATSIGDYVIASGSNTASGSSAQCVPTSSSSSPSPSPSPSASPTASASASATGASPTSARSSPNAKTVALIVAQEAATTVASPAASASASPTASGGAAPTPLPTASTSPSAAPSGSPAATQTRFLCDLRLFPPLSRTLVMNISLDALSCPPVDEYQQVFLTTDSSPIKPDQARIAIGVHTDTVAEQAKLVDSLQRDIANPPAGMTATPTGLAVLATTAYDNLINRTYLLNIAPLLVVAIALFAIYREPRRALLPLVPTALAAGWAPLVLLLLGRLPGSVGSTLGSLNPLTVVLGALVVALGTEFGVVLLGRFYEERRRGLDPDAAAAAASLAGVGRAIRVSALTLGAGFAVLALSGLFPNSLPLVADFGLAVVIDLALAVAAVFLVMLPLAVALERYRPLTFAPVEAAPAATLPSPARLQPKAPRARKRPAPTPAAEADAGPVAVPEPEPAPEPEVTPEPEPAPAPHAQRRVPGVSGRRRPPRSAETPVEPEPDASPPPPRRPGVSGRKRRRR